MLGGWLVAVGLTLSPGQCSTCGPSGMEFSPGMSAGSWSAGGGGMYPTYDAVSSGGGGGGDQLYPFDSPEPWLHGFFQELPAYGGHASFRPHNYKHVLAQMQQAGSWGVSPSMAYSHQWYHRYRQRSGMHPNFGAEQGSTNMPSYQNIAQLPPRQLQPSDDNYLQAAAVQRGYPDTAIPGISTPYYQISAGSRANASVQPDSNEYTDALLQLREQLAQQSFQMQAMQQQLETRQQQFQTNAARQVQLGQPWAQPNHQQFAEQPAYQELPSPSAQQVYHGQGPQNQAPIYVQPQPGAMQNMNQPMYAAPGTMAPQYQYQGQPQLQQYPQQPPQQYQYPAQQMPNGGYGQPQPIMQLPASQTYFSQQQANAEMLAQNYGAQNYGGGGQNYGGQDFAGQNSQAMWQQYVPPQGQPMPMNQPQQFVPYGNMAPIQTQPYQYQGQPQPQQQYQYPTQQMPNDGYLQQQPMQSANGYSPTYVQPGYSGGY